MNPPQFFYQVQAKAQRRWQQLEQDPGLAGPWLQLFAQVQSPRHVVSELLQNADDAGARWARAAIQNGTFVFEHDGHDFTEEEFASLCEFGFSNKRVLHTIGFRGLGFKSTFSLGDQVRLYTPSLAVLFNKQRFTEPVWMQGAQPAPCTRIEVHIQDAHREQALRNNLRDWAKHPASLLFFNHLQELVIEELSIKPQRLGPGPVPNSDQIRIEARNAYEVLVVRSQPEPLPLDALAEVREERHAPDLELPPCSVAIVWGLPGDQQLYAVLPTGVKIDVPFSCNAPFLLDPNRSRIKAPALSPTNRWLLDQLGRLAGQTILAWLENRSLELRDRARAYSLLPKKPAQEDSLESDATVALCDALSAEIAQCHKLLSTTGELVQAEDCLAPPKKAYQAWDPPQLLELLGDGQRAVLSDAVTEDHRQRLRSWGWIDTLDDKTLIDRLAHPKPVPRPTTHQRLLVLWAIAHEHRWDLPGSRLRKMAIVPVEGTPSLFSAEQVVRLPANKEGIHADACNFSPDWSMWWTRTG